jgi:uncharacterized protein involved in exopolysaccharide biosynthesis
LDLGQLLAGLWRQKLWLLACGTGGLVLAAVYSARTPPLWEGGFEVVIGAQESGGLISQLGTNPMFAGLGFGGDKGGGELETELKILQSPSVLNPVFEQVKTLKHRRGSDTSRLSLSTWKQNLSVQLAKGTSVLSITYRDQDKNLILPVLQRVSDAYQSYSGRERRDSLQNGVSYAEEQVMRFRAQAAASTRAADSFRISHGIAANNTAIAGGGIDMNKMMANNSNTGSAAPTLNVQSGGVSQVASMGEPLGQLAAINQQLIRLRQIFTDKDPSVIALERDRDALRRYIDESAGGSLATPSRTTLTKQQAQDLVLRYQELERTARRDTATLDSLENTLMSLQLEQARATKPWETISKPTLLDRPVAPRTSRNLALGLLVGLCSGAAVGLMAERRRGLVFNQDELTSLLPYPVLAELAAEPESWTPTLKLLADGPLAQANGLALIPAGILHDRAESLQNALKPLLPATTQLEVCSDAHQASAFQHQLLVASCGTATRTELEQLQRNLLLQGRPVLGLVLL